MKVYINEFFKTREAAESYVNAYNRAYSPQAYGTDVRIFPADLDLAAGTGSKWAVVGYRYHTAD